MVQNVVDDGQALFFTCLAPLFLKTGPRYFTTLHSIPHHCDNHAFLLRTHIDLSVFNVFGGKDPTNECVKEKDFDEEKKDGSAALFGAVGRHDDLNNSWRGIGNNFVAQ